MSQHTRYEGKPLLRLVELYVLHAIGQLAQSDEKALLKLAPKLASLYGREGSWREILAAELRLPSDFETQVMQAWRTRQAVSGSQSAQVFAEEFVDRYLG